MIDLKGPFYQLKFIKRYFTRDARPPIFTLLSSFLFSVGLKISIKIAGKESCWGLFEALYDAVRPLVPGQSMAHIRDSSEEELRSRAY